MASKIILVTGGNRGIGLGIVQGLAQRSSDNSIILTSRDRFHAQKAIDELQSLGLKSEFHAAELEVNNDQSIAKLVEEIGNKYGRLDVLINNAGTAGGSLDKLSDVRSVYNSIMDTNVTSVALISIMFLPLLRKSSDPRVVNVSSARGSFGLVTSGANPKISKIPYSISKAALNLLTVEMGNANEDVEWSVVNPGHCKTAFNGYRGVKDPLVGAVSAVELALAEKGQYKPGFWQFENDQMEEVPW